LQIDSSVINEEPIEDEESSMHESGRLKNRKKIFSSSKQKSAPVNFQHQFVEDNSDTEDEGAANEDAREASPQVEGDLYNHDDE
jgi:hypothetical protein